MIDQNKLSRQTAKLIARIAENLPDMSGDVMQEWIECPTDLQEYLKGLTPPHDTIISFGQRTDLVYDDGDGNKIQPLYPAFEMTGPTQYDLANIIRYVHAAQKSDKGMDANTLREFYGDPERIKKCLGLRDALEIKKKGLRIFRRLFGKKMMLCWRSIGCRSDGSFMIPYVREVDGGRSGYHKLMVSWCPIRGRFSDEFFSAQFPT